MRIGGIEVMWLLLTYVLSQSALIIPTWWWVLCWTLFSIQVVAFIIQVIVKVVKN